MHMQEIIKGTHGYDAKWQMLIGGRHNSSFFAKLKPVAIGWKVADRREYDAIIRELHDEADKIIETWMNGRWVAKVHLKDTNLPGGVEIIKILERRPGVSDALGFDHMDYFIPEQVDLEKILNEEGLTWSMESNDVIAGYDWVSLWFDGTEAKLKFDTVLDIIQKELSELNERIISK